MGKKSIKRLAIEHYDRMIEHVENNYKKKENTSSYWLTEDIRETWSGRDCAYCKKYMTVDVRQSGTFITCGKCKLSAYPRKKTSRNCCNGLWAKMSLSRTWGTWLKYAKLAREYIKENG